MSEASLEFTIVVVTSYVEPNSGDTFNLSSAYYVEYEFDTGGWLTLLMMS